MVKEERVIKRYTNRKLYDTKQSRYVTLDDIARLIREGEEVHVTDNENGDDLTAVTLAQIILEEEKRKTNLISVPFLRRLIRSGEVAVQDLSDSANRSIDAIGGLTEKAGDAVRDIVQESGRAIDEALKFPQKQLEELRDTARKSVDKLRQSPGLQREIDRLEKSLQTIEDMIGKLRDAPGEGDEVEPESPAEQAAEQAPASEPYASEAVTEAVIEEEIVREPVAGVGSKTGE